MEHRVFLQRAGTTPGLQHVIGWPRRMIVTLSRLLWNVAFLAALAALYVTLVSESVKECHFGVTIET